MRRDILGIGLIMLGIGLIVAAFVVAFFSPRLLTGIDVSLGFLIPVGLGFLGVFVLMVGCSPENEQTRRS